MVFQLKGSLKKVNTAIREYVAQFIELLSVFLGSEVRGILSLLGVKQGSRIKLDTKSFCGRIYMPACRFKETEGVEIIKAELNYRGPPVLGFLKQIEYFY